jgi:DNA-binding MarR family transcriptional regulator/N-acetylglutamate synthase-like GNAT family acetyltransferase
MASEMPQPCAAVYPDTEEAIEAIRDFNRFYTQQVGLLNRRFLDSPYSLTEVRVLYELAQRASEIPTATQIASGLSLDPGYLSRLLQKLERQRHLKRGQAEHDARQRPLSLTDQGRRVFARLNQASSDAVGTLIRDLSPAERGELLAAMASIRRLLQRESAPSAYRLRPLRSGDIGWIIHRQGVLYAEEYGWDATYEALVAEILAAFVKRFDPAAEEAWVAERQGTIVGSVFLVKVSPDVAQLRLLYVEPSARGLGIGAHLVQECIRSAREKKYRSVTLWTNDVLVAARRIYEAAGFRLVREEPHHSFGCDLVGQTWELTL